MEYIVLTTDDGYLAIVNLAMIAAITPNTEGKGTIITFAGRNNNSICVREELDAVAAKFFDKAMLSNALMGLLRIKRTNQQEEK